MRVLVLLKRVCVCVCVRGSDHSEAVFRNGIIATASKEQQTFFVKKLDGHLE